MTCKITCSQIQVNLHSFHEVDQLHIGEKYSGQKHTMRVHKLSCLLTNAQVNAHEIFSVPSSVA